MADSGNTRVSHAGEPATEAHAVTPDDSNDLSYPFPRALYIGTAGDLVVDMVDGGTSITFTAAPLGILPIRVKRVRSTGTAAGNILALY